MISKYFGTLVARDLAVDLGTANSLVFAPGEGVILCEPSMVAVRNQRSGDPRTGVVAIGLEAKQMLGRAPESVTVVRPVRDGVISNFEVAGQLFRSLLDRARKRGTITRPNVIACVPHGVTEVDRRALKSAALSAGAKAARLIEEPIAAAIGAGLPVDQPCANFVLDVGGGTSEVAVIALGGIVYSRSIRFGGDRLDEAIVQYVRKRHNLLIGDRTAEMVKMSLGSAQPPRFDSTIEIRGRDLLQGTPHTVSLTAKEVYSALMEPIGNLLSLLITALEKAPPELSSDIGDRGLVVSGGGALLRGLDQLLMSELNIPVRLVDAPLSTVVRGAGRVLMNPKEYERLTL